MRCLKFLLFLINWRVAGAVPGQFWHISDLHLDPEYNASGDPLQVCPSAGSQPVSSAGVWGDYLCDAPWILINSSIYAMKALLPSPDFILWTGDDTPHVPNEKLGEEAVLKIVKHLTELIRLVFPGDPISVMFLVPGVSPWKTTLPGVNNGANNPGIRVWYYDRDTLQLQDMVTYYLNLTHANLHAPRWEKEYQLTEAFQAQDGSAASMQQVLDQITQDNRALQRYYQYNSVSYDLDPCDQGCRLEHLCAVREVDFANYERCIESASSPCGLSGSLLLLCLMMGLHLIGALTPQQERSIVGREGPEQAQRF